MSRLYIGVDGGGTRTRAVLAGADGEVVGAGYAEGANAFSSGTRVADVIVSAVRAAIDHQDPGHVARGVIAVAGWPATRPAVGSAINEGWRTLGLSGSPDVVPDILAAFAAGSVAPEGAVLVAGTGSIAAAIGGGEVRRWAGGHGWLLGDEGSAVWLGLEGLRAALRALDGRGPETALAMTIPAALGVDEREPPATTLQTVSAAHDRPPAQLGQLAPTVLDACRAGDHVAARIVEAASAHLVDLLGAVITGDRSPAIVLAGSLATKAEPIRGSVRARIADRWPASQLTESVSGAAGAVALAIARDTGAPVAERTLAQLRSALEPAS